MYKLSQIEEMVDIINKDLGLSENDLPAYGFDYGNRNSYITVNKDGYSLIAFGHYRNKENQRLLIKTLDINELLFEIFKAATRQEAVKYELEHRIQNQDTRITYFNKHVEILDSLALEKKFVQKLREYYDYLLQPRSA